MGRGRAWFTFGEVPSVHHLHGEKSRGREPFLSLKGDRGKGKGEVKEVEGVVVKKGKPKNMWLKLRWR